MINKNGSLPASLAHPLRFMNLRINPLTRNNRQFDAPMLFPGYSFRFFHQQCAKALSNHKKLFSLENAKRVKQKEEVPDLMLELGRITAMHRDSRAIHMKLSYNATTPFRSFLPHELRTKRALLRALPQPQKTNEDILLGVFV
jgi:hypothetical protein